MYCRNQQYQPWAIPRTEAVLDAERPLLQEAQAADPIAAILDRLMTVVSKLETRLDDTDRFIGEFRPPVQPQPDPDPPTLQPEMPERRWQPYQPLTHASVTSQWYPPSLTNPPQQVQTRRPTSWDPPGYRQQSGFMPYNQQPPQYHPQDENQSPYGYGSASTYEREPYQQPRQTTWDPPAQQALHGFPPHNQSHNLPLHSAPYGISHPANHPHQTVSFLEPQPASLSNWNPSSLCSATTISPTCSPEFRYGSTELITVDNGVSIKSCPTTAIHCPPDRVQARVEGGHCDIPEREVSTDSILATEVTRIIDRGAAYSHTRNVSNQAIVVTSDISGEEGKLFDDGPPPLSPILQLYVPDVSEEEEEVLFDDKKEEDYIGKVKEIIASIHVPRVPSQDVGNCWNKRGGAYTGLKIIIYEDLFVGDVTSIVHRSTSLDADARLVPPRHNTPFPRFRASSSWFQVSRAVWDFLMTKSMELWHLTHKCGLFSFVKSSGSYMSYPNVDFFLEVFDPGGDNSRLLLSLTLLIASWFPP